MPGLLARRLGARSKPRWPGATVNWQHPLSQDLLSFFAFAEGGGTLVRDATGSGDFLTLTNGPAWAAGQGGCAVDFDATDDQATNARILALARVTVAIRYVYLNLPNLGNWGGLLGFEQGGANDKNLHVGQTDRQLRWKIFDGAEKLVISANGLVNVGQTHLTVATVDGTTTRLYHDGQEVGSTPAGDSYTGYTAPPLKVGGLIASDAAGRANFRCELVAVWGHALAPAQIEKLYEEPYGLLAPPVWRRYFVAAPSAQILAPVADVSAGTWTTDTGATTNLYAAIDEASANDADYVRSSLSPVTADEVKVRLGPATDPAVGTGHIARIRYGKDATGGDRIDLTVNVYAADGTTLVATRTYADIDALTTVDITLTSGEADAIPSGSYASGLVIGLSAIKV